MRYVGYILTGIMSLFFYFNVGEVGRCDADTDSIEAIKEMHIDCGTTMISEEGTLTLPPQIPATYNQHNSITYRSISTYKRITISLNRQRLIALSTTEQTTDCVNPEYSQTADKKAIHRPCDYYVYGLERLIC